MHIKNIYNEKVFILNLFQFNLFLENIFEIHLLRPEKKRSIVELNKVI